MMSIRSASDVADVVAACFRAEGLILVESDLAPEFFDLRTGLAGEVLLKFVNYRIRVAIVLPAPDAYGERFGELANEHADHEIVRFVRSMDEAETWLRGFSRNTPTPGA